MKSYHSAAAIMVAALTFSLALPPPVLADPPPWAPAHGHRKKDKGKEKHEDKAAYAPPYGIDLGRCNRDAVGTTIGDAASSAVDKIADLIRGTIGGTMDRIDHRCTSEILEHAQDNQRVAWQGKAGTDYTMRPGRTWKASNGTYCRDYQTTATKDGRQQQTFGKACRKSDGSWQITT